jgi:hypothetical protein
VLVLVVTMGTGVTNCCVENSACNFITKFGLLHDIGSTPGVIFLTGMAIFRGFSWENAIAR